jgi:ring-1,2-phenylacetyl-CoA epoxidase subunit PaaC
MSKAIVSTLLHLADNALIIGHRNSEWCGHGPVLEQDIAISNIALDYLGQARNFYQAAAEKFNSLSENEKEVVFSSPLLQEKITANLPINEDDFAYLRDQQDYTNFLMLELPKGNWAFTTIRLFLFSTYQQIIFTSLVKENNNDTIKAIANKALKEVTYHVQWSGDWVLRLGDGTEESSIKAQEALNELWPYTQEFFNHHLLPINQDEIKLQWHELVQKVMQEATLNIPEANGFFVGGFKEKMHTEHLSYLLGEMQVVHRSYPNSTW